MARRLEGQVALITVQQAESARKQRSLSPRRSCRRRRGIVTTKRTGTSRAVKASGGRATFVTADVLAPITAHDGWRRRNRRSAGLDVLFNTPASWTAATTMRCRPIGDVGTDDERQAKGVSWAASTAPALRRGGGAASSTPAPSSRSLVPLHHRSPTASKRGAGADARAGNRARAREDSSEFTSPRSPHTEMLMKFLTPTRKATASGAHSNGSLVHRAWRIAQARCPGVRRVFVRDPGRISRLIGCIPPPPTVTPEGTGEHAASVQRRPSSPSTDPSTPSSSCVRSCVERGAPACDRSAQRDWKHVPCQKRATSAADGREHDAARRPACNRAHLAELSAGALAQTPFEIRRGFQERPTHVDIAGMRWETSPSNPREGFQRFIRREPLGVVLVRAPCELSVSGLGECASRPIMAGNRRHSERHSRRRSSAARYAEASRRRSFPAESFSIIHASTTTTWVG